LLKGLAEKIIHKSEKKYAKMTVPELAKCTSKFKAETLVRDMSSKTGLIEAFACVRAAAYRVLGYSHNREQIMAGIVLAEGKLAEMKTGEGKTLAITAPAYLHALLGKEVHIITASDYLAKRDLLQMGNIYELLSVSSAVVTANEAFYFSSGKLKSCSRRDAYRTDITYGTASSFGFDYLRDRLAFSPDQLTQRELATAILDEVDKILLDEARLPLLINRPAHYRAELFYPYMQLVKNLKPKLDYTVNLTKRTASFTDRGITRLETFLGIASLFDDKNDALYYLDNCLKAVTLYHRPDDYLVQPPENENRGGAVILIDKHSGRQMPGRRLSGGLHEALEAKEGLGVMPPTVTCAAISLRAYFAKYKHLCGLSGTLRHSAKTLHQLYSKEVILIPPHRPLKRIDTKPTVFATNGEAIQAVVRDALKVRRGGAPVLICTTSVSQSDRVAQEFRKLGVPFELLNAREAKREAEIIARAGYPARVTITTGMAGRGTNILLGGETPDHLADLKRDKIKFADLEERAKERERQARQIVYSAGGLHLLGLGLPPSRQVEEQIIGRAGRQGEPGYSKFYFSFEDDLVTKTAGKNIQILKANLKGICGDGKTVSGMAIKFIKECQIRAEGQELDELIQSRAYDQVISLQRDLFYDSRQKVLTVTEPELKEIIANLAGIKVDDSNCLEINRFKLLHILDRNWQEYLTPLEELRQNVSLRAYGREDPLRAYQLEAKKLWDEFCRKVRNEIVGYLTERERKFSYYELSCSV
jgi:preprotein translocase subunit SecA